MIKAILFDVGGVLVQLRAEQHARAMLGPDFPLERFWHIWMHSPAVRAHETGKIDAAAFADAMVAELGVNVSPTHFLDEFREWIAGPFDETERLLRATHARYQVALLTNISAVHWPVIESLNILPYAHHVHASYQVGFIKPDLDYFEAALALVGCHASEVVFFDDNALNVAAAQSLGIAAHRVEGAAQVIQVMQREGLLPTTLANGG